MEKKNIATCVILSIITCGIYGIFWFINLTDSAARVNDDVDFSGGKAFLFTIITCGLYSIYWNYKMGKEIYEAKIKNDIPASDQSVLYIILGLFGFQIVNYCLMQNDLNSLV